MSLLDGAWSEQTGNAAYYGSEHVWIGSLVVVRYRLNMLDHTIVASTLNHLFWSAGGDCTDFIVLNAFIHVHNTSWTDPSTIEVSLGTNALPPFNDLVQELTANRTVNYTRPMNPEKFTGSGSGAFGTAVRFDSVSPAGVMTKAYPPTVGGVAPMVVNPSLGITIDGTGIGGTINSGFVDAFVVLLPLDM
jgi:hypothetical protein